MCCVYTVGSLVQGADQDDVPVDAMLGRTRHGKDNEGHLFRSFRSSWVDR